MIVDRQVMAEAPGVITGKPQMMAEVLAIMRSTRKMWVVGEAPALIAGNRQVMADPLGAITGKMQEMETCRKNTRLNARIKQI